MSIFFAIHSIKTASNLNKNKKIVKFFGTASNKCFWVELLENIIFVIHDAKVTDHFWWIAKSYIWFSLLKKNEVCIWNCKKVLMPARWMKVFFCLSHEKFQIPWQIWCSMFPTGTISFASLILHEFMSFFFVRSGHISKCCLAGHNYYVIAGFLYCICFSWTIYSLAFSSAGGKKFEVL